jgi:hypothetical protein
MLGPILWDPYRAGKQAEDLQNNSAVWTLVRMRRSTKSSMLTRLPNRPDCAGTPNRELPLFETNQVSVGPERRRRPRKC